MRGGSGLALAYVLGLVALAATRRREGLQRVLVRAKLLLPPADATRAASRRGTRLLRVSAPTASPRVLARFLSCLKFTP